MSFDTSCCVPAIMPPKKAQPVESDADTEHKLDAFMAQLASMNRRLNKVDLLSEQLGNIKESMRNPKNLVYSLP